MRNIFILLLLIFSVDGYSQTTIDTAQIKCSYTYRFMTDTINRGNCIREDLLFLQIGASSSKCFSYYTYQSDSLASAPNGDKIWDELLRKAIGEGLKGNQLKNAIPHRRMTASIYKNYPHGKITVMESLAGQYYLYEDSLKLQNWDFSGDSVKNILGYNCQRASCRFRGRSWIAWFALDIPISDGPWKFCGLPGLIMEVYDKGMQEYFCINGIQRVSSEPICYGVVATDMKRFQKIERKNFLKWQYEYLHNRNEINEAVTGIALGNAGETIKYDLLEKE